MARMVRVSSQQEIIAKICDQVSNLSDIRLLLQRNTEPPRDLRNRIITALENYLDAEGRPIVRDQGPRLADEILQSRTFDLYGVQTKAEVNRESKPYRGPRLSSGAIAEARAPRKEDRLADLAPTFNTPAEDEVVDLKSFEKE